MHGLYVLGVGLDAGPAAVGEAVAAPLSARHVAVHELPSPASPLTAARHAGTTIEPAPLVGDLRRAADATALVVSSGGGPLAPLTVRYTARDLARELRLPVALAVPAARDAVGLARMGLESVRGAGLAVAAIVLTGWPDPPDRVLLDERRLLGELTGLPVVTFAGANDARAWPLQAWMRAAPAAPALSGPAPGVAPVAPPTAAATAAAAAPAASRTPVALDPYREWPARPVGDPRATPRPQIMAAMLEIVGAEGPILASRAYALYNRASGGKKLTTIARAPLSSAVHWLAQERKVVLTKRDEIPWQDDDLVRLPDTAPVWVRELGPRTLEEVPLDEVAELMRRLGARDAAVAKRAVLEVYGLKRLTTRADEYLGLAYDLAASG